MINRQYIDYIYDTYSKMILNISYTYLKSTHSAQDILQDLILKMMKKEIVFEDKKQEKYWIIRVAINLCKDHLKSAWIRKRTNLDENISYSQTEEQGVLNEVLKLPQKYKTVIYLYYYEQYSINEIAEILNISSATIGTRLARARKILKEKLKGDWDND